MNEALRNWDQRYTGDEFLFGRDPSAFLLRWQAVLPKAGRVLAVADGEGRNGVWLAGRGLDVTSVDGSAVALAKARALALEAGCTMSFIEADLLTWEWPLARFDVVVGIFIQFADPGQRAMLFAAMKKAVRPGGLLLLHGYRPEQVALGTGGPPHVENMYTNAMLRDAFADFVIDELIEHDGVLREGRGHDGPSAMIDLVARRPDTGAAVA